MLVVVASLCLAGAVVAFVWGLFLIDRVAATPPDMTGFALVCGFFPFLLAGGVMYGLAAWGLSRSRRWAYSFARALLHCETAKLLGVGGGGACDALDDPEVRRAFGLDKPEQNATKP